LKRQRNAGSGVFQNSVVLNDNNWNTFRVQIDYQKLCSENSAHSIPREITEEQDIWYLTSNYRILNDSRGSHLLYFNNVLIDLPNQRAWQHMTMSKRFCHRLAKLAFTKFLLAHFSCTFPAPGKKTTLIYTKPMQILRMLLDSSDRNNQLFEVSP